MSETIGSPLTDDAANDGAGAAKPALGLNGRARQPLETVREAYSFACLHCGYGWEQAYDIEHHLGGDGRILFEYYANGVRVPSPLVKPVCPGCGGNKVRIMRAGRVASAEGSVHPAPGFAPHAEPGGPPPTPTTPPLRSEPQRRRFRWFSRRG